MGQRITEELTPWRRFAIICRGVGETKLQVINTERKARPELALPLIDCFMPDIADYEAALELDVRKELVEAQLKWVSKYGPFSEGLALVEELKEINIQILRRGYPGR